MSDILDSLKWRYAVKTFDASKKIDNPTWSQIEEALVLSPSSYGLQPWSFVVVETQSLREELKPHAWGQGQITDASHLVVLCRKQKIDEAFVEKWIQKVADVRHMPIENLDAYKQMMIGDLVNGPRSQKIDDWASRQVYIALGNLLTTASALHVDACPIEGFVPDEFDKILKLEEQGLKSVVVCALGYRSDSDPYANMAKVRYDKSEMILKK